MSVLIGDFNALVSHTVSNRHRRESHINQQTDVAVTKVVNADTLYACGFRPSVHLVMKIAFCHRENTVFLFKTVEHTEIFLHFLAEKMRHFNGAVAFLCFRCSNYIFPVQTLIGLVDRDRFFVKIEISGSQRQQLPLTNTAPVEHFKGVKGNRLIHHLKGKLLVFFFRPEQHFPVFLASHIPHLCGGIRTQLVVAHSMVEDSGKLIVQRFQIGL